MSKSKRIALCQVDGKWPNLALMKLSTWHKQQGDTVEIVTPKSSPLERCGVITNSDKVYASKTFAFTPNWRYLPQSAICGGTGYDLTTELPTGAEACGPDYSLYPQWPAAIGFTTRGCVRSCPFCVVPRKEGRIRVVGDLYDFWDGQREVILLDNNLTAAPIEHFRLITEQLTKERVRVDFSQGLDLRLLTDEHAQLLAGVKLLRHQVRFAWDSVSDEAAIRCGLAAFLKHNSLNRTTQKATVYVLIGYNSTPEEDIYRVKVLRGLDVDPFVMAYNKRDLYQRRFARWVNHRAIFRTVEWAQYGKAGDSHA